ncbi:hypothetical protein NVP1250O_80 [Vibrio phage 1.250.O._10N.261.55.E11]|nr:hypothetical protein NVP1250O_80 [Vibrio phage 1.250.O._10N.261.55.E11]
MIVYLSDVRSRDIGTAFSSKKSYDLSDAKYKLGVLCSRDHRAYTENGTSLEKSIRFSKNNTCVVCARQAAKKPLRGNPSEGKARRRLEDLKLAKELGVSVDDL